MAQPSKAGAIFLFLFGSVFFGFGAFASFAFFTSAPSVHNNANPVAGAIFASVFAIVGAALMFGALYGYRSLQQQAAAKEANPQSPWLWRDDWAQSRAISQHRNTVYGWWIGTALLSMLCVPIVVTNLPPMLRSGDAKVFWLFAVCLLPLALLVGAVRATLRRARYGKTYFEFASLPFSPGRRLSGQIHLRFDMPAEHGIDLRLSCIRRVITGSGKQQSTNELPLWQQEKNVPQQLLMISSLGTSIPVEFDIPGSAYATNHDVPRDQVLWMLHAQADVPGVDYSDDFELPVFGARAKAAWAGTEDAASSAEFRPLFSAADAVPDVPAASVTAPANPKVVVSTTTEGATEFYFPAFRNPTQTIMLLAFTAVWTSIVYLLAKPNGPWFLAIIFGSLDLLLFYLCLQSLFGTARIVVGNGKLLSQRGLFGGGTIREFRFSDIVSVQAAASVQNSKAYHSIRLQTTGGKTTILIDNIVNRGEARWVVQQIEDLAGLKTDTEVVLQNFGRDLGPPPQ